MEISILKPDQVKSEIAIFLIGEDLKIKGLLKSADADINGSISNSMKVKKTFKGENGQIMSVISLESEYRQILLLGIGKEQEINEISLQKAGGKLASYLNLSELSSAAVFIDNLPGNKIAAEHILCNIALGVRLRSYAFNRYFLDKKNDHRLFLKKMIFAIDNVEVAKHKVKEIEILADSVFLARDLVSQPPNILYPASYSVECKKLQKESGLKVTVLNAKDLAKLKMNALLGVGNASERESQVVVMEWYGHPSGKKEAPVALIGKGVTFDSGGISIKPSTGMADMKYDMAGSAAVVGAMRALAKRKAKVNAIGVIGLVENMPDGKAQRPADVVVSMSGQSIEVDNTDAEGRLVLADVLWYTQSKYRPKIMIDLATLTGAIVVALGENSYAGLFSNDEDLAKEIIAAGDSVNEKVWRMPLSDLYDKQINSDIADVRNTGSGRGASSSTAAQFLKRFVNGCRWAHLDIAGMVWDKLGGDLNPKGATGYGVRLLHKVIQDHYEEK
jgi:leucyl aminopeptidase